MNGHTRSRSQLWPLLLLAAVGCKAPLPATEATPAVSTRTQAAANLVLGTIGIDETGTLTTIQTVASDTAMGDWPTQLTDTVEPNLVGDFDNDGKDDFVIRSAAAIGIIGSDGNDVLTAKAVVPWGTDIGGWTLGSSDRVIAVGRFGNPSNPAMLVLQGPAGFAFVRVSAGALAVVTVVPAGSMLWDDARKDSWQVGGSDRVLAVSPFGGEADTLLMASDWGWSIWVPTFTSAPPTLLHVSPNGEAFGNWSLDTRDPRLRVVSWADLDGDSDRKTELVAISSSGLVILHKSPAGTRGAGAMDLRFHLKDGFAFRGLPIRGTLHWLVAGANFSNNARHDLLYQTQNGISLLEKDEGPSWTWSRIADQAYGAALPGGWRLDAADLLAPLTGDFDADGTGEVVITGGGRLGILSRASGGFAAIAAAGYDGLPFADPDRMVATGKFDSTGRTRILWKNIVPPATPPGPAVLTYHNNQERTGLNAEETALTPALVGTRGMTRVLALPFGAPGTEVSSQILYAPGMRIDGVTRNPFFVTTKTNELHVWNLDDGDFLYSTTFRDLENPSARGVPLGISGTPVIDYAARTMYLVYQTANKRDQEPGDDPEWDTQYWLIGWDIERQVITRSVRIRGSYPGADGAPRWFSPSHQGHRPSLLLSKGAIYVGFGSRWQEFAIAYHGWIFRYQPTGSSFTLTGIFNTSPQELTAGGGRGAGIWQGGGGIVGDSGGAVYVQTGNGPVEPANGTYGDYFLKLGPRGYTLQLRKALAGEPATGDLYHRDWDLGSGGPVLIPGSPARLIGGGKEGKYYVLDPETFALLNEVQGFTNRYAPDWRKEAYWWGGPHLNGQAVFWNDHVYHQATMDYLKAFRLDRATGKLDATPIVASDRRLSPNDYFSRTQLSASSRGDADGIVWTTLQARSDEDARNPGGVVGCQGEGTVVDRITAYDGIGLACLWSDALPATHQIPKHTPPTIVGGKLLIPMVGLHGNQNQVWVYQLGSAPITDSGCPFPPLPELPERPCESSVARTSTLLRPGTRPPTSR
jgi:hypothetical protein